MGHDDQTSDAPPGVASRVLFPVTPAQQRCWFLNKLRPGTPSLNVSVRWEIRGRFPAPAIEQAFRAIIERHEILRTRFVEIDGAPLQELMASAPFKLATVDLTMLPEERRGEQMTEIGKREASAPFDLAQAPLIRAALVRIEEDRAYLMITIHQSAFDGWSIRVLGRELGLIGQAVCEGRAHGLPALPLQYGDYALWREECLKGGALDAEASYWRAQLEGMPYFEIEPDKQRPPERTTSSAMVNADLPYQFGLELEAAAKRHGVSFFNFGAAIVTALLARFTGKTDVGIGTQIAGREDTDLDDLIGVFINNLVLRNNLADDPVFSDLVARVAETGKQALIHQNMPFHRLVELLRPTRDVLRTPLISVNVILQKAFMEDARYGEFELLGRPSPTPGALYDFTFLMIGRASGWRMSVEYNTDLFERETAERLLALWQAAMRAAVANPSLRVSELLPEIGARGLGKKFARCHALEQVLEQHPDVDEAVAFTRTGEARPPFAFVTPAPGTRRPLETLPALLMAHLAAQGDTTPPPSGVSVLLTLPREADGELDLDALPAPVLPQTPLIEVQVPPNDIESKLIEIWRTLLGADHIGRASNFFDLGGHSLLAVRMVTQASEQFAVALDVLTLFRTPTLGAFAAYIAELVNTPKQQLVEDWKIVPIQPSGAARPLISINNMILYYGLAQQLGTEQPFIGIQNFKPDADAPKDAGDLRDIAAHYVRLIRAAQPKGPYVLVGLCVAGAIAYEAAQQLIADGEAPPTLIMFDCWAPGHAQTLPWHIRAARQAMTNFHFHKTRIAAWLSGRLSFGRMLLYYNSVKWIYRLLARLGLVERKPEQDFIWRPGVESYLMEARDRYRPRPYPGDVLMFRSNEYPTGGPLFDAKFGWGELIKGKIEIVDVAAGHLRMCTGDSATVVAERVRAFLHG